MAALLLKQANYEVVACTVRMHDNTDLVAAESVAKFFEMDFIVKDSLENFQNIVLQDFYKEYYSGRTPNPCVLCNKKIKWKTLIDTADALGITKIATGHYATIKYYEELDRYVVGASVDSTKDQTYMLWRLPQEYLSRTIFPLGKINSKLEVRKIAAENNIPSFDKGDSQDICFISNGDYRLFLQTYLENNKKININFNKDFDIKPQLSGNIILYDKIIGKHSGTYNYTVGQRRGLNISYSEPLYIKSINSVKNEIEVGLEKDLYNSGLIASNINLLKYTSENFPQKEYIVKIRYKDNGKPAICKIINNKLIVEFNEKRKSITPGQSAVLYENNEVVAGGIISESF